MVGKTTSPPRQPSYKQLRASINLALTPGLQDRLGVETVPLLLFPAWAY